MKPKTDWGRLERIFCSVTKHPELMETDIGECDMCGCEICAQCTAPGHTNLCESCGETHAKRAE